MSSPLGRPRRAAFWFDPDDPADRPVKLWTDETGVRLFGGQPEREGWPCDLRRPALRFSTGDRRVTTEPAAGRIGLDYPVEVFPYTDPWAPFNPQHEHAPLADSLTFNPAYMDEFRNFQFVASDGLKDITAAFREYYATRERYERDDTGDRPLWLVEMDRFMSFMASGGEPIQIRCPR